MAKDDIIQEVEKIWENYEAKLDKRTTKKSTFVKVINKIIEIHNDCPEYREFCKNYFGEQMAYYFNSSIKIIWNTSVKTPPKAQN